MYLSKRIGMSYLGLVLLYRDDSEMRGRLMVPTLLGCVVDIRSLLANLPCVSIGTKIDFLRRWRILR